MKRSASENTMAMSSTGTRSRRSGRRKSASASVSAVDVVVYVTTRLAVTSSTMRTAKKHPRARPAGTRPNDPTSATGGRLPKSPGSCPSKGGAAPGAAWPTSKANPLNTTANAASTYTGTSSAKNRRRGMRDETAAAANSAPHSTSPDHVSTRNNVTEYIASSTIFTRASHAWIGEVPGM